jgi:putative ABC transport system permease protein
MGDRAQGRKVGRTSPIRDAAFLEARMNGVALRILLGDRAKYIGLIFGIAFATMLMSNQISIFTGLMLRTAGQILDAREADIWVMDPRVEHVDEIEPMTDMQLGRVRGVDGVDWAVPFFKGLTVAHTRDGMLQQIILLGVDDATLTGVAPRLVLGSVENLKQPDAMIIDQAGFQFMWPGEAPVLGKVVELNDHRAVIVGISDASAPFTTYPVVYTKYSNARNYVGRTRKQMSFVLVGARPGVDTHQLAQRITADTGLKAPTWRDFTWATIGYYLRRTGIPVNFGITVALGFVVGAAVVGQTFYIFVLENLRQFGALKAMGVANGTILCMVLLQAMVVAGIGYAIGIGLCAGFFEITSRVSINLRGFELPWQVAAGTACTVLVIIVIASFASLRKVMVVDPAIVFRG